MKISPFSAALLVLAAGSEANPVAKPGSPYRHHRSKRQDTCVVRSTNKTIKAIPAGTSGAGAGSTTPQKIAQSVVGTGSTTPGGNGTASSPNAQAQPGKIKTDPS